VANFTDTYKKARTVVTTQSFADGDWKKFLTGDANVAKLLGPKGISGGHATVPSKVRDRINKDIRKKAAVKQTVNSGDVLYEAAQSSDAAPWQERAGVLKLVRHLHHAHKTGGKDVWVFAPPKGYGTWLFDELVGTDDHIKAKLAMDEEIFSSADMKHMTRALQLSLKVVEDARHKLTGKSKKTLEAVKRWFLDENCTATEEKEALGKLNAGLKKIAVACNSKRMVFTDYPDWQTTRDKYYGAAFRGGEGGGFPVIYLEGAFTRLTGNSGQMWLCAETIIHELSHHEVKTNDHAYDSDGLKPNAAGFPYSKAIDNADSWGYFAIDLAGYLSSADRKKVLV
jgi:hypothetical protein